MSKKTKIDVGAYQEATKQFAVYPPAFALEYLTLGLASEAGEVAGKMSKLIRGDYTEYGDADEGGKVPVRIDLDEFKDHLTKELGDVMWMVSEICNVADITIADVMQANLDKLESRKNRDVIKGSGDDR